MRAKKYPVVTIAGQKIDFNLIEKQIQEIWDCRNQGKSIEHININCIDDVVFYFMHAIYVNELLQLKADPANYKVTSSWASQFAYYVYERYNGNLDFDLIFKMNGGDPSKPHPLNLLLPKKIKTKK